MKVSLALSWLASAARRLHLLSVSTSFFCSFTYSWRRSIRCFSSLATSSAEAHSVTTRLKHAHLCFASVGNLTLQAHYTSHLITEHSSKSLSSSTLLEHLTPPILNLLFYIIASHKHIKNNQNSDRSHLQVPESCPIRNATRFLKA